MNFLTEQDFEDMQVRTDVLAVLKISTTTLDTAEIAVQEQVSSYIRARFDAVATFAAIGTARNPMIVMYMVDLILYHLHSNTAGRVMPKTRQDRFDAAIAWLTSVSTPGGLIPDLPEIPNNLPDPLFKFGGNDNYSRRW
jgi:predicted lysophospholipase L1 biosynthesis ABC-type transport system permease subunit